MTAALIAAAEPAPKKQRNYMMVFEVTDYTSQLKEAVEFFFNKTLQKGDQLIVVTPVKLVGYSAQKLAGPKKKLISDILKTLKTDISAGASRYRTIFNEMLGIAQHMSGTIFPLTISDLQQYMRLRRDLATLRGSYEERLLSYAKIFRKVRGDNHLMMFLERSFRPIPDKDTMDYIQGGGLGSGDMARKAIGTFLGEEISAGFDLQKVQTTFRYASIRFHFVYLKSKKHKPRKGVEYIETSGNIYNDFSKLSKATNGIKMTTSKPSAFVKLVRQVTVVGSVSVEVINQSMEEEKKKKE
jgi:hypothetical protein